MDCPNCGAYNTANTIRCRRCNQTLPVEGQSPSSDETPSEEIEASWRDRDEPEVNWNERSQREQNDAETTPYPEPWHDDSPRQSDPPSSEWSTGSPGGYQAPGGGASGGGWSTSGWSLPAGPAPDVPNYLWQSIAVTLCCCLPLGIPAIVFASRVNPFVAAGDYERAREQSQKARNWALAGFIAGVLWAVCWVIYVGLGASLEI